MGVCACICTNVCVRVCISRLIVELFLIYSQIQTYLRTRTCIS